MDAVLSDVLVIDLSRAYAGPYCAMMLGDLGAQVIKIERPESGDDTRSYGPPFVSGESANSFGNVSIPLLAPSSLSVLLCIFQKHHLVSIKLHPYWEKITSCLKANHQEVLCKSRHQRKQCRPTHSKKNR